MTKKTEFGDPEAFNRNWNQRGERDYLHWTRSEPTNQIQLAFRQHWSLFNQIMDGRYAGGEVLEVGCGRGSMSAYFADAGYSCTLLDLSTTVMERAEEVFHQNGLTARFDVGDALAMPYESESFDVVFSIGLLEHFDDIEAAIAEQVRVLRVGGLFLGYVVPGNKDNIQNEYEWINDILRAIISTEALDTAQRKEDVYRSDETSFRYLEAMNRLGLKGIQASGTYPLPMISYSPEFPFTLLNDEAEAVIVEHFSNLLERRRAQGMRHPWLCDESIGQAFLVWGLKG